MTSGRESSEDYLEAILVIRRERGWCRNVDIAERMGVTRPSVTKALAGLSSRSHVEVVDRDVRLTPEGHRLAGATLEKHEFFRRHAPLSSARALARAATRHRAASKATDIAPSPPNPATLRCSVCRSERSRA